MQSRPTLKSSTRKHHCSRTSRVRRHIKVLQLPAHCANYTNRLEQYKLKLNGIDATAISNADIVDQNDAIDFSKMNKLEVKQVGLNIQDKSKEAAMRALKEGKETEALANNIVQEQLEQRKRIEYIEDMEGGMESTLKRVQGHIRYFAKHFMTDKIIIALIILVALGIVGVILFKIIKKPKVAADQIK